MSSEKLSTAITAIKNGDKATGSRLLNELLKDDPSNETAWIWLTACIDDVGIKIACLKKALTINPNNRVVIKALSKLEQPPQPTLDEILPNSAKEISLPETPIPKSEKPRIDLVQDTQKSQGVVGTPTSSSVRLMKSKGGGNGISKSSVIKGIGAGVIFIICIVCGIIGLISLSNPSAKATSTVRTASEPTILNSLSDFESSEFCKVYDCVAGFSGELNSGRVNHAYDINNPDVLVEVETINDKPIDFGLGFFNRDILDSNDYKLVFLFLKSVHPGALIDDTIKQYIQQNVEKELHQICEANPIKFGLLKIWPGRVLQQTIIVGEDCQQ